MAARIIVRIPRVRQLALALLCQVVTFGALVAALVTCLVILEALR